MNFSRLYLAEKAIPLSFLHNSHLAQQTLIDYLHCVLLGVTNGLINLWFNSTNKTRSYYIGQHISLVDKRLPQIRTPSEVTRQPGIISKLSDWKGIHSQTYAMLDKCMYACLFVWLCVASQYRAWLLYYMVPVLENILGRQYWLHAARLASVMHTLLSSSVSVEDIPSIQILLH